MIVCSYDSIAWLKKTKNMTTLTAFSGVNMETPESDLLVTGGTNPVIIDDPTGFRIQTNEYIQIFGGTFSYQENGRLTPDSVIDYQLITEPDGTKRSLMSEMALSARDILAYSDEDYKGKQELIFRNSDTLNGSEDNDILIGYRGQDIFYGNGGNDVIRAGNGRDTLMGGQGSDTMYGGFGRNTFMDERDGWVDSLYFKSDQFAYNYIYGSTANSPNGEKSDILIGLDSVDIIFVQGVYTDQLSFSTTTHIFDDGQSVGGIGIFAQGYLEAVYVGGDLTAEELQTMTRGVLA